MFLTADRVILSATDLVRFLKCSHATYLDLIDLENPQERAEDDTHVQLLKEKGLEHEEAYLTSLKKEGYRVAEIDSSQGLHARACATKEAVNGDYEIIYQAAIFDEGWFGLPDFLINNTSSDLGAACWEPWDIKLARSPRVSHLIQLSAYSTLLGRLQQSYPLSMGLVLGDSSKRVYRYRDFAAYCDSQVSNHKSNRFNWLPGSSCLIV